MFLTSCLAKLLYLTSPFQVIFCKLSALRTKPQNILRFLKICILNL